MKTRSLLFAVTVFALSACQEDLTAEKTEWETSTKGWAGRIEKVKKAHEELAAKVKAFTVPEGETALVDEKAALDKSVATANTAITNAEHELSTANASMDGLFKAGKKVRVEVAMSNTKQAVEGPLMRAESLVSAANSGLDTLEKKVAAAKASGEAVKSRTDAWLAEVKKKGASVNVEDLVFAGEAVDAEKSKVALQSLVQTFKSCPDLRAELNVVARGEGELGAKRAESIKSQLTSHGVDAAVLTKLAGSVTPDGEEKVSLAVTTPCK
jgi:hypothetical protein